MNRLLTAVVLGLGVLAIGFGAASGGVAKRTAHLQLVSGNPVKLRGTGFFRGERVRVRVVAGSAVKSKVVYAGRAGGFLVTFATISHHRCDALFAEAVGARGSQARLKPPPQPLCPPN